MRSVGSVSIQNQKKSPKIPRRFSKARKLEVGCQQALDFKKDRTTT